VTLGPGFFLRTGLMTDITCVVVGLFFATVFHIYYYLFDLKFLSLFLNSRTNKRTNAQIMGRVVDPPHNFRASHRYDIIS
jgi:hypothetical protein